MAQAPAFQAGHNGSIPLCHTNFVLALSWSNGYDACLSSERSGFNSPWERQMLSFLEGVALGIGFLALLAYFDYRRNRKRGSL